MNSLFKHTPVLGKIAITAEEPMDIVQNMSDIIMALTMRWMKADIGNYWQNIDKVDAAKKVANYDSLIDLNMDPVLNVQRAVWNKIEAMRLTINSMLNEAYEIEFTNGNLYEWQYVRIDRAY